MDCACEVRPVGSWLSRLRGLLFTGSAADPVFFPDCSSVHTFGMTYPIDIAFLSSDGMVLKVRKRVVPRRVVVCRGSAHVLERPSTDGPWLEEGQRFKLELVVGEGEKSEKGATTPFLSASIGGCESEGCSDGRVDG